jgi:hypothetical protein
LPWAKEDWHKWIWKAAGQEEKYENNYPNRAVTSQGKAQVAEAPPE